MRHGKYQSRWFSYVNRFLWFPISFFYFHENWFQQIPRDYKIFTIIGQHFFNPINGLPREIHKPPGNKEGTPLRHPLKKRTIFKRWTWHNFKLRRLWFSLRFMIVIIFRENTVGFLDRGNFMSWGELGGALPYLVWTGYGFKPVLPISIRVSLWTLVGRLAMSSHTILVATFFPRQI